MSPLPGKKPSVSSSPKEKEKGCRVRDEFSDKFLYSPPHRKNSTHEELQERSLEQDAEIRAWLLQYDKFQAEQKIHQWASKAPSNDQGMCEPKSSIQP